MTDLNNEESICPLTQKPCMGTKCAVAVEVNHYTVDPYGKVYYCGLISTYNIYKHGEPRIIDYRDLKEI